MKLTKVEIAGYRSISKNIAIYLDPNVTVILGPNDHGKTNFLDALTLINNDTKFDAERDLNWDHINNPDEFPSLKFEFELDSNDREVLLVIAQEQQNELATAPPKNITAATASPAAPVVTTAATIADPTTPTDSTRPATPVPTLDDMPGSLRCQKIGLTKNLSFMKGANLPDGTATAFMSNQLPRVELIRAQDTVPDSVTFAELSSDSHEFMRGIFYYAGIDKNEFASLFLQTDSTMMRLEEAQRRLNDTLRANWSKGSDLEFRLVHESKTDRIVLRIKDPAVGGRLVRHRR